MLKTIKNIRKLYNAKLLVISNDKEIETSIKKDFDNYFKALVIVKKSTEALRLLEDGNFDLVVIDTDVDDDFEYTCEVISKSIPTLPKIIISNEIRNEDLLISINNNAYTFLTKPLKADDLKLSIIMCLNQTKRGDKIEFNNGIYFDEYRDQFYKIGGYLIDFTRLEKAFMKLLISRRNEITDYDTIKNIVWQGKNMSIYTMRNIVNKIRQKTYYEIIKNHSNKGYTLEFKE